MKKFFTILVFVTQSFLLLEGCSDNKSTTTQSKKSVNNEVPTGDEPEKIHVHYDNPFIPKYGPLEQIGYFGLFTSNPQKFKTITVKSNNSHLLTNGWPQRIRVPKSRPHLTNRILGLLFDRGKLPSKFSWEKDVMYEHGFFRHEKRLYIDNVIGRNVRIFVNSKFLDILKDKNHCFLRVTPGSYHIEIKEEDNPKVIEDKKLLIPKKPEKGTWHFFVFNILDSNTYRVSFY